MIDKNSKISLTYQLGGEYLLTSGYYTSAKLNKEGKVLEPSIMKKSPIFSKPKQHCILTEHFVFNALKRPEKPQKSDSFKKWSLYNHWNKLTINEKLNAAIEEYVKDQGGFDFKWNIA